MNPFEGYTIAPADPAERDKFEEEFIEELKQEYTPLDKVDYTIGGRTLSFAQIKTVTEGEEWYRSHHPEFPDDILKVMARHQFGRRETQPMTKKPRKPVPPPKQGVTIEYTDVVVEF